MDVQRPSLCPSPSRRSMGRNLRRPLGRLLLLPRSQGQFSSGDTAHCLQVSFRGQGQESAVSGSSHLCLRSRSRALLPGWERWAADLSHFGVNRSLPPASGKAAAASLRPTWGCRQPMGTVVLWRPSHPLRSVLRITVKFCTRKKT